MDVFLMEIIDQLKQFYNLKVMEKKEYMNQNLHSLDLDMF